MLALFSALRRFLAPLLAMLLMLGVSVPQSTYSVLDEEACLTNFTVISDVHMEGNNKTSRDAFIREMYDVKNNTSGNDALVLLGDNTMNGQHIENLFLYGILSQIDPADQVFMTLGNHDTGNGENRYDSLVSRFYTYYNDFYNVEVSTPYYAKEVNGYHFLFLGSEEDDVNSPVVSDAQLQWLDAQLAEATADGQPVFVFGHHPYTHYENPQALVSILTSYKNVFFFSGHTHRYDILQEELAEGVYHFNLPRVTELNENDETFEVTGQGLNIEVYEDRVEVRARNFFTSEWMDAATFPLV